MKTVAIVQARMSSTRFPGKVMRKIDGVPMIGLLLLRLTGSREIDQIVLATSEDVRNAPLIEYAEAQGFGVHVGSELDVLGRYAGAAREHDADAIIRVTGDCPLIDAALVDACVRQFRTSGADYLSNTLSRSFPDGLDVEVFSSEILFLADAEARTRHDREHVTPFMRRSPQFSKSGLSHDEDFSQLRWTVDEPEDFEVVRFVFSEFSPNRHFSWTDVLELYRRRPEAFKANDGIPRNEGSSMNLGQKLWRRAKRVIPGGNMLLSKRPEMFLPEQWPSYFSRAKGCRIWDLEGRELIDMSIMGIGTNILGYGHPEVDDAVRRTVDTGNMSTLNCPEEVELAERLVEIHPWADMVRFARTGGEANAIAIRIARAASGRDKVAICGYHGWHDWYLSANLADDDRLDGHLLPGLEPNGVPRALASTVLPFDYNDPAGLEELLNREPQVGVIKMEVSRNHGPQAGFLERVRELATERGIVLIFDECTSGFRETFGGLHKKFGVEPDMAMFGKALGNGYAITATIGVREVMEAAQTTFISSTFWTERIGPSAALKTLEVMERECAWEQITATGLKIRALWHELANHHGLNLKHSGLPALTSFTVDSENALAYKTLVSQEMLKKGYLAGNSVYVSTAHSDEEVAKYGEALDGVFGQIRRCEEGVDVFSQLAGPVCHAGFTRLN